MQQTDKIGKENEKIQVIPTKSGGKHGQVRVTVIGRQMKNGFWYIKSPTTLKALSEKLHLSHLIHEPMAPSFEVHVFGLGVVELAVAQFAVELYQFVVSVSELLNVFCSDRLRVTLILNKQCLFRLP